MVKAVLTMGCACWLAACASGKPADSADIARVADVKSSFGPEFHVTTIAPTGIDPKLFGARKLPEGLRFEPPGCAQFAAGQAMPPGLQGNMAAVSAEGDGNRFITIALETSQPVPVSDPGQNCAKVGFTGGQVRGVVEVVEAPQIAGARTLGVHRVVQTLVDGKPHTGELYDYSAHFGRYQVIVVANPLVVPGKPVVSVDTQRARDLLVKAVTAVKS
ncbi:DUF5642 family protein [Mycobacterium botniense]|uniref:DUF5642 domain-containing protein n=1 Tax=Mycobacterium botniense TaxID=84962 RepID=A0A7I9XYQ8_9MYCO|nr:DUF5642 family protein [Mycobacterium botniense]GFG74867.1 hypothetical protein MBOT_22320 [Mycobacterium botniense]